MHITRRRFAGLGAAGLGAALVRSLTDSRPARAQNRPKTQRETGQDERQPWAQILVRAAESQIGVTRRYDPAYRNIAFPDGDVERTGGVCTDVIIRAYRDGFGYDLQEAVNRDMTRAFSAYPKAWALSRPDPNIDHRRVLNLERFFLRRNAGLPKPDSTGDYLPGDLVTQRVGLLRQTRPHIAIVSDRLSVDGLRPLVIHNIGAGTRLEDILETFPVVYRFRFNPGA